MRRGYVALALALSVSACGGVSRIIPRWGPPTPPVLRLTADATTAAQQLGEVMIQLRSFAFRLTALRVLPQSADTVAGKAASEYQTALGPALTDLRVAITPQQVSTAVSPLIGSATQLIALLEPVAGISAYPQPVRLLSEQLAPTLVTARLLVHQLRDTR